MGNCCYGLYFLHTTFVTFEIMGMRNKTLESNSLKFTSLFTTVNIETSLKIPCKLEICRTPYQ